VGSTAAGGDQTGVALLFTTDADVLVMLTGGMFSFGGPCTMPNPGVGLAGAGRATATSDCDEPNDTGRVTLLSANC
jgi:hypothetical protein